MNELQLASSIRLAEYDIDLKVLAFLLAISLLLLLYISTRIRKYHLYF